MWPHLDETLYMQRSTYELTSFEGFIPIRPKLCLWRGFKSTWKLIVHNESSNSADVTTPADKSPPYKSPPDKSRSDKSPPDKNPPDKSPSHKNPSDKSPPDTGVLRAPRASSYIHVYPEVRLLSINAHLHNNMLKTARYCSGVNNPLRWYSWCPQWA